MDLYDFGLVFAVLGLTFLLLFLPEEKTLVSSAITKENVGEKIKSIGIIENLFLKNGNAFFEIRNSGKIRAFFYSPSEAQIALLRNKSFVEVVGVVSRRGNSLELVVEKVSLVD